MRETGSRSPLPTFGRHPAGPALQRQIAQPSGKRSPRAAPTAAEDSPYSPSRRNDRCLDSLGMTASGGAVPMCLILLDLCAGTGAAERCNAGAVPPLEPRPHKHASRYSVTTPPISGYQHTAGCPAARTAAVTACTIALDSLPHGMPYYTLSCSYRQADSLRARSRCSTPPTARRRSSFTRWPGTAARSCVSSSSSMPSRSRDGGTSTGLSSGGGAPSATP